VTDLLRTNTEPGLIISWGVPGADVVAGEREGLSGGYERVLHEAERVRCRNRSVYVQWATADSTTYAAQKAQSVAADSTFHQLTWSGMSTNDVTFRCRVRRTGVEGATAGAKVRVRVRYQLADGAGTPVATLRISDGTNSTDVTCPGTGAWTYAHGVGELSTQGTDQEVALTLTVKVLIGSGSATFYLSGLVIVSDEPLFDDLATWDFSATTQPEAFAYTRSGTWALVDNAAQSHVTFYGADTWGLEVDADGAFYLPVTPGHTNLLTAPRAWATGSGNWQAGTGTLTANTATGPDGTASIADRYACTSAQYGAFYDHGSNALLAYSGWGRAASGTSSWQLHLTPAAATPNYGGALTVSTTWQRRELAVTARYVIPNDGRFPVAGARAAVLDLQQVALGVTYAPPYTAGTVGPTVLAIPGEDVVRDGWFDVLLCGALQVYEDAATPTADQYLFCTDDGQTHLRFRASDNKFVLTVDGVAAAVSASSHAYAAGVWSGARVWSRADGCGFSMIADETFAGAGPYLNDAATGSAQAQIATPATVYLFSDGTAGGVFPCKVYGRGRARELGPAPVPAAPYDPAAAFGADLWEYWTADDGLDGAAEWLGHVEGRLLSVYTGVATEDADGWATGVAGINFAGAVLQLADAGLVQPCEIWMSVLPLGATNVGVDHVYADGGSLDSVGLYSASDNPDRGAIGLGASTTPALTPSAQVVVAASLDGASSAYLEGGAVVATGTAAADPGGLTVGAAADGSYAFVEIVVRKIVVVKRTTTAPERAALAAFLLT
jgi:hypothetical protein